MGITTETVEWLHQSSLGLARTMLDSPQADVRPFLLLAWPDEQGGGEVVCVDAATFHVSRDGSGKEAMMAFIRCLLNGEPAALSALKLETAPDLICHAAEAWQVVAKIPEGGVSHDIPSNPLKDHPERSEILFIQIFESSHTHFARHDLARDQRGCKAVGDSPMEIDGDLVGRLALHRPAMH